MRTNDIDWNRFSKSLQRFSDAHKEGSENPYKKTDLRLAHVVISAVLLGIAESVQEALPNTGAQP